jgi:type III secretion protein S
VIPIEMVTEGLLIMIYISFPPIIMAVIAGLLLSFFQAITQIQEQALGFALKLIVMMLVITVSISWSSKLLYNYTLKIFDIILVL